LFVCLLAPQAKLGGIMIFADLAAGKLARSAELGDTADWPHRHPAATTTWTAPLGSKLRDTERQTDTQTDRERRTDRGSSEHRRTVSSGWLLSGPVYGLKPGGGVE